jgi:hypothetical protein
MKAPDKIYVLSDLTPHYAFKSFNDSEVEYIRKDALLEKVKELRDDAGSRDDHYEKDAIIEYNAYEAVMDIIKSM